VEVCAKQIIMLLARRPASGIAFKKDFVCIGIVSLFYWFPLHPVYDRTVPLPP
jgi:hypothetical protein